MGKVGMPPGAGRVMLGLQIPRRVTPYVLLGLVLLLVAALPFGDRKLWPISVLLGALLALGLAGALAVEWLTPRLTALCEHGFVVRGRGKDELVPWQVVTGVASRTITTHGTTFQVISIEYEGRTIALDHSKLGPDITREAIALIDTFTRSVQGTSVDEMRTRAREAVEERAAKGQRWVWPILGALASLGVIYCGYETVSQTIKYMKYEPIDAVVVSSRIRTGSVYERGVQKVVYEPEVLYRYNVRGKNYQRESIYPIGDTHSNSRARVAEEIAPYPKGTKTTAYFDPDHPERAFLIKSFSWVPVLIGAICLPFAIVGAISFVRLRRRERDFPAARAR